MSKKIIALILAIATILGCTTAFAWEDASPKTEADYAKELLYALDIIDVVTDKGYAPDQVLTRAELAEAILGLNGYRDTAAYGSCFADVDEATEHAAAIATLVSHGIVAKDIYYNPESNAKFEHAAKMIVYSLGFGQITETQGGWLQPILNVARESGVTKGVNVVTGTDLTADMLAVMLFNSLDAEMLKRKSLDEFETIKGETLLLNKLGIKKTKGIVTANAVTTLTDASPATGRVSIDWTEYNDENQVMSAYLGMEAVCYYEEEYGDVVFGYPTDRNYVMTISANDILPDASGFGYEAICYREVQESGSYRSKKAKVAADADVLYNGKAFPEYTDDDFKIESGRLVLIDSDNDNIAEVVMIEETQTLVVESVDIKNVQIYDMFGTVLDLENTEFLDIIDMYGSKIELSTLSKWNVLSVIKSADGEYAKIVSYNDPVTGEVEAYWTEDGETFATIDGDTFKVSPSYIAAVESGHPNAKAIVIGQTGTYYLNGDEKISAVNIEVDTSWQYAFLLKAQLTDDDGVRYRLLMDQTGFKWYYGAEKMRVDGDKKEGEERKEILDDDNEVEEDRKTVPQMIKIQMDGQGNIKKIDTIARGPREDDDSLTRVITTYNKNVDGSTDTSKMKEMWTVRTRRFGTANSVGVMVYPDASFVITAPTKEADIYNESMYAVLTGNLGGAAIELTYNAYDADWGGVSKAAIIYDYSKGKSGTGSVAVVHSIESTLNDDDEVVYSLRCYKTSGAETVVPIDIDYTARVNKGDIISYYTNLDGEIDAISKIFDSRDAGFTTTANLNFSGEGTPAYTPAYANYFGKNVILDKNNGYIKTLASNMSLEEITDDLPYTKTQIYSLADASILLYDSTAPASERITTVSESGLNEYLYSRNSEARVILYSTYTQLKALIIYI